MDGLYTIKLMSSEEFMPLYDKWRHNIFSADHCYLPAQFYTQEEKSAITRLGDTFKGGLNLYLGAFDDNNNFVGWTWGFQENRSTFYMCNSAVLPDHRRRGVYQALLKEMINLAKEKGFQVVYSRHCMTNNAVIIPKLKEGFIISKMEMNDVFGVLIHLHYYNNDKRRKVMDYRSGQLRPDQEIKDMFEM